MKTKFNRMGRKSKNKLLSKLGIAKKTQTGRHPTSYEGRPCPVCGGSRTTADGMFKCDWCGGRGV